MIRKVTIFTILILMSMISCTVQKTDIVPESHAVAYFTTFESFVNSHTSKTQDIKYLAFDYSNLDSEDLELFVEMIKEFCKDNGFTYLEGTTDELIHKGYITVYELQDGVFAAQSFSNGVLVQISTISTNEYEIVSTMSMWRGNLSAIGSTFTTTFENGTWNVECSNFWVS
ncbi:MAG: hypothetical protein PHC62_10050 [Candidatus Izemoplasmatales bacterium]|nr:hypothetical protein [Candidatus Izemoplasmatales bacterium]